MGKLLAWNSLFDKLFVLLWLLSSSWVQKGYLCPQITPPLSSLRHSLPGFLLYNTPFSLLAWAYTHGFPATSLYHPHPYSSSEVKVNMFVTQCAWLLVALWTVAHQAALSMGFSRQEYWSGLPFSSPGDLPDPGIEPICPTLQADSLSFTRPCSWLFSLLSLNCFSTWFPPFPWF